MGEERYKNPKSKGKNYHKWLEDKEIKWIDGIKQVVIKKNGLDDFGLKLFDLADFLGVDYEDTVEFNPEYPPDFPYKVIEKDVKKIINVDEDGIKPDSTVPKSFKVFYEVIKDE